MENGSCLNLENGVIDEVSITEQEHNSILEVQLSILEQLASNQTIHLRIFYLFIGAIWINS
jgi:hypothetical protein